MSFPDSKIEIEIMLCITRCFLLRTNGGEADAG
jgi:hypothetical protein